MKLPTVVPGKGEDQLHGIEDACSDDHLWLVPAVLNYVTETGDFDFLSELVPFADAGEASVYQHLRRAVDFTSDHQGSNGIAQGLRADWNDCLNLGGGESSLVTFLHIWAAEALASAAQHLGFTDDTVRYRELADTVRKHADQVLWRDASEAGWYVRGFTKEGQVIGSPANTEGKIFLEHMPWAVISGTAGPQKARLAMDAVSEHLSSDYGTHLVWPAYTQVDDSVGYVTRVYPGVKENGAIFCHPNAWPIIAETILGRGDQAMHYYDTMAPPNFNDIAEIRGAEPYVYSQFIYGRDHELFGKVQNPWLTGTAGWMYQAVTRHILGVRPDFDGLIIDPCIPADWDGYRLARVWRGTTYEINVHNPEQVNSCVAKVELNGKPYQPCWDAQTRRNCVKIPQFPTPQTVTIDIWLGK